MKEITIGNMTNEWIPSTGEVYWYVRAAFDGTSFHTIQKEWNGSDYDFVRLAKGNVYPESEEANKVAVMLTARVQWLRRRTDHEATK